MIIIVRHFSKPIPKQFIQRLNCPFLSIEIKSMFDDAYKKQISNYTTSPFNCLFEWVKASVILH